MYGYSTVLSSVMPIPIPKGYKLSGRFVRQLPWNLKLNSASFILCILQKWTQKKYLGVYGIRLQ